MTVAELLTHLHRGGGAAYLWALWPDRRKETFWFPVGKKLPPIPAAWAEANIYFAVNPTATMGSKNERSKIATVSAINCLFAEFDAKTVEGGKAAILSYIDALWDHGNGLPFPTAIIDSGGGYHCYWLLENTVTVDDGNREHVKALQAAWVSLVGADPASSDLARVLRLPGTVNRKYDPPRPVQIIEADYRRLYLLDVFEQFTNLDDAGHAAQQATAATPSKQTATTGDDVIATFNQSHRMVDLLTQAGYTLSFERGNVARLVRPGGASASVVVFVGDNTSFHHSSSDPLHSEHARDAFDVWTILAHGADTTAAYRQAKKEQGKWEEPKTAQIVDHESSGKQSAPGEFSEERSERMNDLGNTFRFVRQHGHKFRFTAGRGWLAWDGRRWEKDATGATYRAAKATALSLFTEAARKTQEQETLIAELASESISDERRAKLGDLIKEKKALAASYLDWAKKCGSRGRIEAIVALAQSELPIAERDSVFDTNTWLLNCQNGTVNLKTGTLQPHRQSDHITALSPSNYDPAATCPTWDRFLHRIMAGNQELIGFLRRMAGYCLTGATTEQVLFFLHGAGSNGKTTFIKALCDAVGADYAIVGAPDLLLEKRTSNHPTEVADLAGKRLVASIEVADGRRMAEGLVKQLTGGDTLKARYMREDFFQFAPTHKLILGANHKPEIRGTDHAIWRRIRLLPFTETITDAEKDPLLPDKLASEAAGILAWAVRGCLEWQRIGLQAPAEVLAATAEYRADSDTLGQFLSDCTVRVEGARTKAGVLYAAYQKWAAASGVPPINLSQFGAAITERGIVKEKVTAGVFYCGVGILDADEKPAEKYLRD